MWPYILLIAIPFSLQLVCKQKKYRIIFGQTKVWYYDVSVMQAFWLMLIILLILRRQDVGIDLNTYDYIFGLVSDHDWSWSITRSPEIGWNFMVKLIASITSNFRWVIVLSAASCSCFFNKTFTKYSKDTALVIAIFIITPCFSLLFSGLRQSIAIAIGLLSFRYAMEKKKIPFLCCVMLAITFHTSAFMIAFIYPLCQLRMNKTWLIWVIPSLICVFALNRKIFSFFGNILERFTEYDATITLTGSYTMLVLFVIFAIYSYVIPDEKKLDPETIAMRNILLFSVTLQMFAPLHNLAMRMNYYFIIFIPLLIPRINECRKTNMKQVTMASRVIMLIIFVGYFFFKTTKDNALQIFPYYFLWE